MRSSGGRCRDPPIFCAMLSTADGMRSEHGIKKLIFFIDLGINYKLNNNAQQQRQQCGSETLMILNAAHNPAVAIAHVSLSQPEPVPTSSNASSSATAPALMQGAAGSAHATSARSSNSNRTSVALSPVRHGTQREQKSLPASPTRRSACGSPTRATSAELGSCEVSGRYSMSNSSPAP